MLNKTVTVLKELCSNGHRYLLDRIIKISRNIYQEAISWKGFSIYLFMYFGSARVWTQGLVLARQVLYYLSHASTPFCCSDFSDRVSHFCPGPASDCDPSTYASLIVGITGANHHIYLVIWDRVSVTFFSNLGWIWTAFLLSLFPK
jgi:hypothetical protein